MSWCRHGVITCAAVALVAGVSGLAAATPAAQARHGTAFHPCSRAAKASTHHNAKVRARCAASKRGRLARRLPATSDAFGPVVPVSLTTPSATTAPADPAPPLTPAPAPTPAPTPAPALGRAVQVSAGEFWLTLSRAEVAAGSVRVEYNTYPAEDPHSLVLVRADGSGPVYRFGEQAARSVADQDLQLSRGTWVLFCNLADHEAKGMKTELTVR